MRDPDDPMPKNETPQECFWSKLDAPRSEMVRALQTIMLAVEPGLEERFKWNAPSYAWQGEDRITFNLSAPSRVRLVFHAGATRKEDRQRPPVFVDDTSLLTWQSDIRALATFQTLDEVMQNETALRSVIRRWLDSLA